MGAMEGIKQDRGATLGWGPGKPLGGGDICAETWFLQTRQQAWGGNDLSKTLMVGGEVMHGTGLEAPGRHAQGSWGALLHTQHGHSPGSCGALC